MSRLDYSSLSLPVTSDDIRTYAPTAKPIDLKATIIVAVILWLLVWVPGFIGAIVSGDGLPSSAWFGPLFAGSIIATVAIAAFYGSRYSIRERARMTRFALSNGATYSQHIAQPNYAGMIFDNGHTHVLNDSLSFKNGIEIGNYQFTTGSGKREVTHDYAFMRVALNRNLPHMVLDATSNNFLGTSMSDSFDRSQRLQLEGDFNKHFDVYVPEGYATDALYVFTPDAMEVLVRFGKKYDLEIVGNELYVYKPGKIDLSSEPKLVEMLLISSSITDELRDQARNYVDERAQQRPKVGNVNAQELVIADKGRRLKQKTPVFAILYVALVLAGILLPAFLPEAVATPFILVSWPLIVLFPIGYVIAQLIRRR